MTSRQYEVLSRPFRSKNGTRFLNGINFIVTRLCYAAYPLSLIVLGLNRDERLLRAVLVPAISFVLLSLFRSAVNAPRPYQVLDIQPLIHKDTRGKSFPSRHVFSVFVIGMTLLWLMPAVGAVFLAMGVVLAVCRVIGGVHWPKDVLAGALAGIVAGIVGFWLL